MPGRKVEEASVEALFAAPKHPYTRGLMASIPAVPASGVAAQERLNEIPGTVPSLVRAAEGLRLRAALHARDQALRRRVSAADGLGRRPSRGVLARGRSGGGGMTEALLEVTDLKKHYPVRAGVLRRQVGTVHAVDGVSLLGWRRRDARPRRRIRLRQVDGGAQRAAAGRADLGPDPPRRRGHHPSRPRRRCGRIAARCRSCSRTRSPRSIRA